MNMSLYRDTYVEIDLNKLKYNVQKVYQKAKKPLMAIIKADAYGHGYQEVAACLSKEESICMYAVATLKEAIDLRKSGIQGDILILGAIPREKEDIDLAIAYDISLTLFSLEYMDLLTSLIEDQPLKVHIKLDTGMNRIGIKTKQELDLLLDHIDTNKFIIDGIFTHFATADGNEEFYKQQLNKFYQLVGDKQFKYNHCSNSAGLIYHHEEKSNLGRIGIVMYGLDPAGNETSEYQQVMSMYTKVAMVKKIHKGEYLGYGITYQADKDEYIATVPVGYADGIIRKNQGRKVYINGNYYEIVGRVCMDQMMIRVDENVHVDDQVEIFGDHISLSSMAKDLDTIPYEIICLITKRVDRVYKKD